MLPRIALHARAFCRHVVAAKAHDVVRPLRDETVRRDFEVVEVLSCTRVLSTSLPGLFVAVPMPKAIATSEMLIARDLDLIDDPATAGIIARAVPPSLELLAVHLDRRMRVKRRCRRTTEEREADGSDLDYRKRTTRGA